MKKMLLFGVIILSLAVIFSGSGYCEMALDDGKEGGGGGSTPQLGGQTESITITINNVNRPPVAVADSYTTFQGVTLASLNVLLNDSDPDSGDIISVTSFDAASTQGGAVSKNGDGTLRYVPPAGFSGTDTFNYTISDGGSPALTAVAAVTIVVNVPNNCPGPVKLYNPQDILVDCFQTIQAAINDSRALDGYKIVIDPGRYFENVNFQGKALTLKSTNPSDPNIVAGTAVDGGRIGRTINIPNCSAVHTVKIEGLTINRGYLSYLTPGSGGGIYSEAPNLIVKNCAIKNNEVNGSQGVTVANGGGMYATGNNITVEDTVFELNWAWSFGAGAVINTNQNPVVIRNCSFSNNFLRSTDPSGFYGGAGLEVNAATIENTQIFGNGMNYEGKGGGLHIGSFTAPSFIRDCDIGSNLAGYGGGIYARGNVTIERTPIYNNITDKEAGAIYYDSFAGYDTTLTISDSTINNNTVLVQGNGNKLGGGIFAADNVHLINTTIQDNVGPYSGGGIYINDNVDGVIVTADHCNFFGNESIDTGSSLGGAVTIGENGTFVGNYCVFRNNHASSGGAIGSNKYRPHLELNFSELTKNLAEKGGAIFVDGGSMPGNMYLTNVTLADNTTSNTNSTGALHTAGAFITAKNNILWNPNSDVDIFREKNATGGTPVVNYSLILDSASTFTGSNNIIGANPLFVDTINNNYHLQAGSPCIDSGDPSSPLDPDNTRADMGAYYFSHLPACVGSPGNVYLNGVLHGTSIQAAINSAPATGAIIRVSPGTYVENINFLQKELTLESISGNPNDTIIEGCGAGRGVVITTDTVDKGSSTLRGFTITGGTPLGAGDNYGGGGIYVVDASPTIENCIITDNQTNLLLPGGDLGGAGIRISKAFLPTEALIRNSTISGNSAFRTAGGGIVADNGAVVNIENTNINDNTAYSSGAGLVVRSGSKVNITGGQITGNDVTNGAGGGINALDLPASGQTLIVTGTLISNNTSSAQGGGINVQDSSVELNNVTISNNQSVGNAGGGIAAYSSPSKSAVLAVNDSTVTGNSSWLGGGGIRVSGLGSSVYINESVINSNTAQNGAYGGGGIKVEAGALLDIKNSILARNVVSGDGAKAGAIYAETGTVNLLNATVAYNSKIDIEMNSATFAMHNSISWDNELFSKAYKASSSSTTITYSDIYDGTVPVGSYPGAGNKINADPLFVNAASDDFRLGNGSPAIDAANETLAPVADMNGDSRYDDVNVANGGPNGNSVVDMGALERHP